MGERGLSQSQEEIEPAGINSFSVHLAAVDGFETCALEILLRLVADGLTVERADLHAIETVRGWIDYKGWEAFCLERVGHR